MNESEEGAKSWSRRKLLASVRVTNTRDYVFAIRWQVVYFVEETRRWKKFYPPRAVSRGYVCIKRRGCGGICGPWRKVRNEEEF